MTAEMLTAARLYARMGLKVLPCRPDKSPATNNGVSGATLDPKLIEFLFDQASALGIAGGDGLLIIDEDRPGAVHELEERFGDLPMTVECKTPRGGRHLYFRLPDGLEPKSTTSLIAQGVDTKGRGGYCVAPPSPGYTWIAPPDEQPIEELPEGWLQVIPSVDVSKSPKPKIPMAAGSWVQRAIARVRDEGHTRNDTGFWLACQLRDEGMAIEDAQPAMIEYQKAVSPLSRLAYREKEALQSLRSAFGHDPRESVGKGEKAPQKAKEAGPAGSTKPELKLVASTTIVSTQYPPIRWAVEDVLPAGLSMLAGPPKAGKSLLATLLGCCVATGRKWLGYHTHQGGVLYLDGETSEPGVSRRLKAIGWADGATGLEFACPPIGWQLDGAGLDWLSAITATKSPRLIVVDTLERLIPQPAEARWMNAYESGVKRLGRLQSWARDTLTPVLLIHHTGKNQGKHEEDFDSMVGSRGLTGTAETLLTMRRHDKTKYALGVRGRDVAALDLMLERDGTRWNLLGDYEEQSGSEERRAVMEFLRENPRSGPKTIADTVGFSVDAVKHMVYRMLRAGMVVKDGRGLYSVNSDSTGGEE